MRIVIFTDRGARILHVGDVSSYAGRTDVLIEPKIPRGVPPHLWTLNNGKIATITQQQWDAANPVDTSLPRVTLNRTYVIVLALLGYTAFIFALGHYL